MWLWRPVWSQAEPSVYFGGVSTSVWGQCACLATSKILFNLSSLVADSKLLCDLFCKVPWLSVTKLISTRSPTPVLFSCCYPWLFPSDASSGAWCCLGGVSSAGSSLKLTVGDVGVSKQMFQAGHKVSLGRYCLINMMWGSLYLQETERTQRNWSTFGKCFFLKRRC